MPGRDQAECLQQLPFFQLNETEHAALAEFNRLYKAALVADMARLIGRHQPAKEHLRHYLRIKIEGEYYPEYQTARWQLQYPGFQARNGLFQLPNGAKLQPLTMVVPACIAKLTASSLTRLAFSSQGRYLYHYLTHCVNDTLRQRADRNQQSIKDFYTEINQMDSAQRDALLQQKQGQWPAPYVRLAAVMDKHLSLHENDIACTDGKPLDFIASVYVLKELKDQQKRQWLKTTQEAIHTANPQAGEWTKEQWAEAMAPCKFELHACQWTDEQYDLLCFAAANGSYIAAFTITRLFDQSLADKSPEQAQQDYDRFHQQWFAIFSQQYKAAGSLLFVNIQKILAHRLDAGSPILTEEIYRTYVRAQEQEASHKNTLRLSLRSDDCQPLVEKLHAHVDSPMTITSINDALDHLKLSFPSLRTEFNAIDSQSPIRKNQRSLHPFASGLSK